MNPQNTQLPSPLTPTPSKHNREIININITRHGRHSPSLLPTKGAPNCLGQSWSHLHRTGRPSQASQKHNTQHRNNGSRTIAHTNQHTPQGRTHQIPQRLSLAPLNLENRDTTVAPFTLLHTVNYNKHHNKNDKVDATSVAIKPQLNQQQDQPAWSTHRNIPPKPTCLLPKANTSQTRRWILRTRIRTQHNGVYYCCSDPEPDTYTPNSHSKHPWRSHKHIHGLQPTPNPHKRPSRTATIDRNLTAETELPKPQPHPSPTIVTGTVTGAATHRRHRRTLGLAVTAIVTLAVILTGAAKITPSPKDTARQLPPLPLRELAPLGKRQRSERQSTPKHDGNSNHLPRSDETDSLKPLPDETSNNREGPDDDPNPNGPPQNRGQRKRKLRMPVERHEGLDVVSMNIRTLSETKFTALLQAVKQWEHDHNNKPKPPYHQRTPSDRPLEIKIIVLTETHSCVNKTYNYVQKAGWTIHSQPYSNPTLDQPTSTRQGGVALLIKNSVAAPYNNSNNTLQATSIQPTNSTFNNPFLGHATWKIHSPKWESPLNLCAIYWPKGQVTAADRHSESDHILGLHNLCQATQDDNDMRSQGLLIAGDLNLHLGDKTREEHLNHDQINRWGSRLPDAHSPCTTTSDHDLWRLINDNKLIIASSRTTESHPQSTTWYKNESQSNCATSTIDYAICNLNLMPDITTSAPIRNSRLMVGTDHEAILTRVQRSLNPQWTEPPLPLADPTRITYNLHKMRDPESKTRYNEKLTSLLEDRRAHLESLLNHNQFTQASANAIVKNFTHICLQAADSTIGSKNPQHLHPGMKHHRRCHDNNQNAHLPPPTPETIAYRQKAQEALKRLTDAQAERLQHQPPPPQLDMKRLRLQTKRAHRDLASHLANQRKQHNLSHLQNFCLSSSPDKARLNIWKHIKNISSTPNTSTNIPAKMQDLDTGHILPTDILSAKVWHELRARMSGPHTCLTQETQTALKEHQDANNHIIRNQHLDDPNHEDPTNAPFTMEELLPVIRGLPSKKSPGLDNLPYELLRNGAAALSPILLRIINKLWISEVMPNSWCISLMRMVYKKGPTQDARNWRGIVLINGLAKIYEALIRTRLITHTETHHTLSYRQFGYRAHHTTTEAIYTLTQTIKTRYITELKPTFACFIDFRCAFPAVNRDFLWTTLHKKGIRGRILHTLRLFYSNARSRVIHPLIPKHDTFPLLTGLTEGSKLSPLLYSYMIDDLLTHLQQLNLGIHVTGGTPTRTMNLGSIAYADDLCLLASTQQELQLMIDATQQWAARHMASINATKTYTMAFFEPNIQKAQRKSTGPTWYHTNTADPSAQPTPIQECNTFTYLGVLLDPSLTFLPASKAACSTLANAQRKTNPYSMHHNGLHPRIRISLWKQLVLSSITHILPFLTNDALLKRPQAIIDAQLKEMFTPHSDKCRRHLPMALSHELSVPPITTLRDITLLRFHAHLHTVPDAQKPLRPSLVHLHISLTDSRFNHHLNTSKTLKNSIAVATQNALSSIDSLPQWQFFTPISLQQHHNLPPPAPRTVQRHWIRHYTHLLNKRDEKTLLQWAQHPPGGMQHLSPPPISRAQTYVRLTMSDRIRNNAITTPGQPSFPNFHYITSLRSTTLVQHLLHLRTQSSTLPSHVTWPPDNPFIPLPLPPLHTPSYTDPPTHYTHRFCRICTPPRSQWPPHQSPGKDTPQGSETHLLLHCPGPSPTHQYLAQRPRLSQQLDEILYSLDPGQSLHSRQPWSHLPDDEKVSSLLGAYPPPRWGLSRKNANRWLPLIESTLLQWWQPILSDSLTWFNATQAHLTETP